MRSYIGLVSTRSLRSYAGLVSDVCDVARGDPAAPRRGAHRRGLRCAPGRSGRRAAQPTFGGRQPRGGKVRVRRRHRRAFRAHAAASRVYRHAGGGTVRVGLDHEAADGIGGTSCGRGGQARAEQARPPHPRPRPQAARPRLDGGALWPARAARHGASPRLDDVGRAGLRYGRPMAAPAPRPLPRHRLRPSDCQIPSRGAAQSELGRHRQAAVVPGDKAGVLVDQLRAARASARRARERALVGRVRPVDRLRRHAKGQARAADQPRRRLRRPAAAAAPPNRRTDALH